MEVSDMIRASEQYQAMLLADPYRPGYHFACPGDNGFPGDPNGAFFADGVYHLMYLYRNSERGAFHWGHLSSADLLHWRRHPDALTDDRGDGGCFSGGAFLDDDGTAYLTFWKFPAAGGTPDAGGIQLACAKPPYEEWTRIEPIAVESRPGMWGVTDLTVGGELVHTGSADPSNIWKKDGWYYMQTGNLVVLNEFGRRPDSEERYRGGWTELYRSRDLKNWEYRGRYYQKPQGEDMPDDTEDDMCPSYLPLPDKKSDGRLTDRMLQLFIAHNRGTQYFIGREENERLLIEKHGRMSWKDNSYFAPEALIDGKNRQIAWAWLMDDDPERFFRRDGWYGTYSFPRCLWMENGELRMAPADELDRICFREIRSEVGRVNGMRGVKVSNGKSCRIRAKIERKDCGCGFAAFRVLASGAEYTEIGVDFVRGVLYFDAGHSGESGRKIREEAPFVLGGDEALKLDLFVDKSIAEVYANDRQAICRRVFPGKDSAEVYALSDGADFGVVVSHEVFPTNFY
jgi:beta-fructofuranosidase